jgi:uncharacterized membrane-anchored protein YhcB (DUF1043 family)
MNPILYVVLGVVLGFVIGWLVRALRRPAAADTRLEAELRQPNMPRRRS